MSEADTCRKLVVPRFLAAGWDGDPHSIAEQRSITDGRIVPVGKGFIRKEMGLAVATRQAFSVSFLRQCRVTHYMANS